jgi:uncharacterized membrane protein
VNPRDLDLTKALEISLMMVSGSLPLPPASLLLQYEKAFPGLVEKIVSWTDSQRQHRQDLERKKTDGAEKRMNRGQLIAGSVAVYGLTSSAFVGIFGNPWAAIALAIVSIGGPTAAIWLARGGNLSQPNPKPPQSKPPGKATPRPQGGSSK